MKHDNYQEERLPGPEGRPSLTAAERNELLRKAVRERSTKEGSVSKE